jgi:hypothetical protein
MSEAARGVASAVFFASEIGDFSEGMESLINAPQSRNVIGIEFLSNIDRQILCTVHVAEVCKAKGARPEYKAFRLPSRATTLYPLALTGPVVPSHSGDDREQGKLSGRGCGRTLSRSARS